MTGKPRWGAALAATYFAAACIGLWQVDLSAAPPVVNDPLPGTPAGFEIDGTLECNDAMSLPSTTANGDDWIDDGAACGVLETIEDDVDRHFVDCNWGNKGDKADSTQFKGNSNKNQDLLDFANDADHKWNWGGQGGGPQKNDITNTYVHRRMDNGDKWIFVGAETRSTNGDSHIDFEINQAGVRLTNDLGGDPDLDSDCQNEDPDNPDACCESDADGFIVGDATEDACPDVSGPDACGGRCDGDLVLSMDFRQGGVQPVMTVRVWDASTCAWSAPFSGDDFPGDIFSQTNSEAIGDIATTLGGFESNGAANATTVRELQFVEGAINQTALGFDFGECIPDATMMVKTRSSDSFTAELKDFALFLFPVETPEVTCTDDEVCDGFDAEFCASPVAGEGIPPYMIVWEDDAGVIMTCTGVAENGECCLDFTPADLDDDGTYTATITDSQPCEGGSCDSVLVVNANPTADAGGDDDCLEPAGSLDAGGSPTATGGTPGYTFLWEGDAANCLSSTTDANPTLDKDCAGVGPHELCVTVTDSKGCTDYDCGDFIIHPEPTADAGSDDDCLEPAGSLDVGGSPTATGGTPGYTYLWEGDAANCLSSTTDANPTLDKDCAGVDTHELCVTVTDSKGCVDDDCGNFVIHPEPTADAGGDADCLEPAGSLDVGGAPTADGGTPGYTFLWEGDAANCLSSTTDANPTLDKACAGADTHELCVTITDSKGCTDRDCGNFVIHPEPTASAGPDVAECLEDLTDPSIGGSPTASGGTPSYTFLWEGDAANCLSSTTDANPTFDLSCAGVDDHELCVTVTDSNGCVDDDCMTVTVHPEPVCTINPLNVTVGNGAITISGAPVTGGTTPYSCTASFNAASGWVVDNNGCTVTPSMIQVTFTIPSPGTAAASAVLSADITDANGCLTDCSTDVGIDVGCTARPNQEVCEGDPDDLLSVVCADVEISSPSAAVEIFQFDGDIPCPTADALGSGAFTPVKVCATVPNLGSCCTDTDPPSGTPGVLTYCALTTESNGLTAVCDARTTIDPEPTADAGEDQADCREALVDPEIGGDPTASGGSSPYTFLWEGNAANCLSSTTDANPTFDLDCPSPGTYQLCVTVTDSNGCEDDDCVDVTVHPEPTADAGPDVAECLEDLTDPSIGGSPTASGGTPSYTFLWEGNAANCLSSTTDANPTFDLDCPSPGTYQLCVTVTDSNGCEDDDCVDVTVHPEPTADAGGDDDCLEPAGTLQAGGSPTAAGGTPGYTYLWEGNAANCLSSTTDANPTLNKACAGVGTHELCVTITDFKGCTDRDCGDFVVHPEPICTVEPELVCVGEELCVVGSGGTPFPSGEPYTYAWTFPDGTTATTRCVTTTVEGTYSVNVTDSKDCRSDDCFGEAESCDECLCLVIIDEDTLDNGIWSVEQAAAGHTVTPDWLVNDDSPTEVGNPPLRWNVFFPGDVVVLPGGQVDDEGVFALPETLPSSWDLGTPGTGLQNYVDGIIPQSLLDKIPDVMPLRNQELALLAGRTCVAVVYDSDISMNYLPILANLQGARYGLFFFTVLDVRVPGTIPESQSSTSLYELEMRVEEVPDDFCVEGLHVPVRDHEPDSIQITRARYNSGSDELQVFATSNFAPGALMTISIEGFVFEDAMTYNAGAGRYEYLITTSTNLDGRRVTVSTDEGGAYNDVIR